MEEEEDLDSSRFRILGDSEFVKTLKQRFPASTQKWMWIGRAIAHEVSPKLGNLVQSVSPDLGDLHDHSGQILVNVISTKTSQTVTVAEFKYLQSLIQRACGKDKFQTPSLETGSFLFYLLTVQGSPHLIQ